MSIAEITKLSKREKFQIMEVLWDDMRSTIDQAETDIPMNHKDILDSRRARVENGDSKLLDWDEVKDTVGKA